MRAAATRCSQYDQQELGKAAIKPFSTPSALGSTTLPKVVLSYRWVIDNASVLAQETKEAFTLRSPVFQVVLPLRNAPKEELSWTLLAKKNLYHSPTSIYLCQGYEESSYSNKSKVLISDCTFSLLNPENCEEKHHALAPTKEWELCESQQNCVEQSFENDLVKECLLDGTLTVQVKANLLCITDPNETVDRAHNIPMDNIRSEMHSLYKDEVFTDATLKCKSKEFKVHRAVLASQSPVFKKIFEVDMKEKGSGVVKMDFTPAVISDLVTYLYASTAPNVSTLAKELLNAANKYELPRLFTMCENELKMEIKVANVVDTLLLADKHSAVDLKKACFNFIRLHSVQVHNTSKWKSLKDNLDQHAALLLEAMEYRS